MQACKPGSVSPPEARIPIIYLASALQQRSSGPPAPTIRSSRSYRSLFGLSTRKVYHAPDVATRAVGSYSTFSPLPTMTSHHGKSVFCGTVCPHPDNSERSLPVRKYDALCCPDFPLRSV